MSESKLDDLLALISGMPHDPNLVLLVPRGTMSDVAKRLAADTQQAADIAPLLCNIRLRESGFVMEPCLIRDPNAQQDDLTWFLTWEEIP